jgi:hypothetical protein
VPTVLNQLVAIEKGVKNDVNKATAPLFHAVKSGPGLFSGLTKTYEPADENGEVYPSESAKTQFTVGEILARFAAASTRQLDVTASKEKSNTRAEADVVLPDGTVVIEAAPVTFLLQFEKYLEQEVKGLVTALPVLDPALEWEPSAAERDGVSQTPVIKRARQKKVQKVVELSPATDRHPAQVQLVGEDVVAGYWSERKFSGAVSAARKQELTERVEALIAAVKFAREKANSVEVTDLKVGESVFGYLFR